MCDCHPRHRIGIAILFLFLLFTARGYTQSARSEVDIPDIPGYHTLAADLHIHTVFSDGSVWPDIRVYEAWSEGLDILSITDHIEYHPYQKDIPVNMNRSFELASARSGNFGLMLIRGAEITRSVPPGHLNALFLEDADALNTKDWKDAVAAAIGQGAFLFFNHPGWYHKDGISRWYEEHEELYRKGWLQGVEVVNGPDYYPEAHQWCLDKKLTFLGDSDAHSPIQMEYDFAKGEHRPMTLIFVRESTEKEVKEALTARRTVVYWKDKLIGEEDLLEALFQASLCILNPDPVVKGQGSAFLQVHNLSEVDIALEAEGENEYVTFPQSVTLPGHKTVILRLQGKTKTQSGLEEIDLPYRVTNFWGTPQTGISSKLRVRIQFASQE